MQLFVLSSFVKVSAEVQHDQARKSKHLISVLYAHLFTPWDLFSYIFLMDLDGYLYTDFLSKGLIFA